MEWCDYQMMKKLDDIAVSTQYSRVIDRRHRQTDRLSCDSIVRAMLMLMLMLCYAYRAVKLLLLNR